METLEEMKARLMQRLTPAGEAEQPPVCTELVQEKESRKVLTDEIRTFIVKALACFDTPSQVVEAVKTNFGIEITRSHVYAYHPKSSQRMSPRWREIYAVTREAYLREVGEFGITQKTYRLAMLDRMTHNAMANHQFHRAAEYLEQAAKECGGLYENRRPIVLQLPAADAPYVRGEAAAETAKTISAAATIVSIGNDGAGLSPLSGPLPARNNSATCADA
jgi:hypothetical protein